MRRFTNHYRQATPQDRELLLAHVLGKPIEWVIAHPEADISPAAAARYRRLLRRRLGTHTPTHSPSSRGEPLPHLMGEQWFYGRPFTVNRHVLIPRPETELLVELALGHIQKYRILNTEYRILDVGTGSGCIAVTLAVELPSAHIIATDVSPAALRVARANAKRHNVASRITFIRDNLLNSFIRRHLPPNYPKSHDREKVDSASFLIVANLPYLAITEWQTLPRSIRDYEPRQALDGGPDGLKHFRQLFKQLTEMQREAPSCKLHALLEIDPRRKRALTTLLSEYFPLIRSTSVASDERTGRRALPDPARGVSKRPVPREGCTAGNREVSCSPKTLPEWRASWHRDLAGRYRVLSIEYVGSATSTHTEYRILDTEYPTD